MMLFPRYRFSLATMWRTIHFVLESDGTNSPASDELGNIQEGVQQQICLNFAGQKGNHF